MADTPEGDPLCDVSGLCEPLPCEADQTQAMCQHCGGWRYRDYPRPGNWGTWEPDLEKVWVHRDSVVDTR